MPSYKKKQNKLIEDVRADYQEPINHLDNFLKTEIKQQPIETIIQQETIKHPIIEEDNTLDQEIYEYTHLDIKNKVDTLTENELSEIYKIIKNNNEKHTINKNGIFINLNSLKPESIKEISKFIYFCEKNDKKIDEEERMRDIYKQYVTN